MQKLVVFSAIAFCLLGCKTGDGEETASAADLAKTNPSGSVPGCESGGTGVVNNPHCELPEIPPSPEFHFTDLYKLTSPEASFGNRIASGDFNCDGVKDLAVMGVKKFQVISGSTGQIFYSFDGFDSGVSISFGNAGTGSFSNAGDFDNDTCDDLLVTDSDNNDIYVFSPKKEQLLKQIRRQIGGSFGYSIDTGHDLNGDGIMDFVVGAPFGGLNYGGAYLISGLDGSDLGYLGVIHPATVHGTAGYFGKSVAFGEFDGTGGIDVAVGDPFFGSGGLWASGALLTFSTDTLQQIGFAGGRRLHEQFGNTIQNLGDLNNDGKDDLAVSAIRGTGGGFFGWDYARLYRVTSINGNPSNFRLSNQYMDAYGQFLSEAGDFNGDGISDVIVSAPLYEANGQHGAGRIEVLSGVNFSLLHSSAGSYGAQLYGIGIASMGDINGDGMADIAVSSPWALGVETPAGQTRFIQFIFGR